ncbi:GumC family protein [Spirosoma rigui]|uniref:GumC family protein n=1 Tax=Spirosoma rigui TaxID=564064 RepID=UPI0009B05473|nr:tyrosine-protein kinase [Spirosoma rigui]
MKATNQVDQTFGQEYIKFLLTRYAKNWYWFVVAIGISWVITYLVLARIKPVYSTQASILVSASGEEGSSSKEDILRELDIFSSEKNIDDEMEILKSYTLAEKVVNDLGLDVNYSVRGRLRQEDIYRRSPIKVTLITPNRQLFGKAVEVTVAGNRIQIEGVSYPYNRPIQTPLGLILIRKNTDTWEPFSTLLITTADKEAVIKSYVERLKVSQATRMSYVLRVKLEDTSIERATAYINRLIHWYDLSSLEYKNRTASNTLQFINGRLSIILGELSNVEKDIQNYKTRAGIVDLSAESSVFLEKVKENDTQLNQVNIQLGALQEVERYIASKSEKAGLAPAMPGLESPVLTGLLTNLFDLEAQREKLIRTAPEGSTVVEVLDNQIRMTKANIADNTQSLRTVLISTRDRMITNNKRVESVIRTIPQKERVLLDISRQQGIKGGLYTYLLQKREETALSLAATVSDLRVVDTPKGDATPIKPRKSAYYLFALVMGLLVPIVVLWLLDFLNNKISRKAEIEEQTNTPIIGELIQADIRSPMEVTAGSRSLISEQIRALRANIHFFTAEEAEGPQTILVTSSISGEGKSFVSLNLGASMAITGRRVVLLELDMRRPKLYKYLNVKTDKGLSSFLVNRATLEEIIQPVEGYPDLFFIPCGPLPPNPSELLSGKRIGELFAALREGFDVVIADTPPVGLVSDAFSIAAQANITLYLLRHLYTNKVYLKNIEALYQEKRFKNMSLLINGIVTRREYEYNYGYGYDPEYGYGYKAGYHDDDEKPKKNLVKKGFSIFSKFWK